MRRSALIVLVLLAVQCTPAPLYAQPASLPPCIMFSTLLNGVNIHPIQGTFRLHHLQAVFLPEIPSNDVFIYSPENGGALTSKLKRADGSLVANIVWYAEKLKPPYYLLSAYKLYPAGSSDDQAAGYKLTTPGDYLVEFYLNEKLFYRFPFTIEALVSSDPYNPESVYRLNGAWNDYAYLLYDNADVTKPLVFKIWLRNDGTRQRKAVKVTGALKQGGKVLAEFGEFPLNYDLSADWIRYEIFFGVMKPNQFGTGKLWHTNIKTEDLLKNGTYQVTMDMDGKAAGVWEFTVKNGQIQHQGRQVRSSTDPLDYIEGGKDAFWVKRK